MIKPNQLFDTDLLFPLYKFTIKLGHTKLELTIFQDLFITVIIKPTFYVLLKVNPRLC